MDELRSLEGVGNLLSQKLNQNDNKIRSKPKHQRSTSVPTKLNGDTTASITISTSAYFPPQLAETFANGIMKGFRQDMPTHKPNLVKSSSGFVKKDIPKNDDNKSDQPPSKANTNKPPNNKANSVKFQNVISPTTSMSPPMSPNAWNKLTLENQYGQNSSGSGPASYTSNRGSIGHGILAGYGHFQALPSSPSFRLGSFRQGNSLHLDLGDINNLLTDDENGHSTRTNGSMVFPGPITDSPNTMTMQSIKSPEEMEFPPSPTNNNIVPPLRKVYSNNELFTLYSGDENMSSTDDILSNNTAANTLANTLANSSVGYVPHIEEKMNSIDMDMAISMEDFMQYQSEKADAFNNIGNGASGIVKKAFHIRSCKMVAIKQCRSKKKNEINAFINEAKLYEKFNNNSYIANILGFGKDDQSNFAMAMEYMDLGSVDALKIHTIKNNEMIVKYVIYNTLLGLIAIHNKLYVHNDIKPANILCNKYGEIKLSDFGTVLMLKNNEYLLKKNNGTQRYQSPEKLIGKPLRYNCKTDIWSIGVTTFELLFGDYNVNDELAYINNTPNINNKKLYNISNECSHFILCCFEKDYKKRKSANELIKHSWFKDMNKIQLNNNIWPWYIPMPDMCMVKNMIYNPNSKDSVGRQRGTPINGKNKGIKWAENVKDNNGKNGLKEEELYNEDLLFMISALIIYYSAQFFDLHNAENEENRYLHRRRSQFDKGKNNGKTYNDDERITNMAKYACCSKDIVLQKIRLTVNYIKAQIANL